ncbi:MAG: hypothetical protein QNI87_07445 [Erythrobacter sp.]|uniref:hypothetical protein n=1 Tax=Erythrobacter sp. TaxID=1042 RepID=UPI00261C65E0|nr:hypothetical protein [Erythrobacter sp.]MDJ0978355.1 hypothetical protein [Erythrobacter sp.]
MLVERRRSAFPLEFLMRVGAAWAIISALLVVINWGAISSMRFPDPDDTMRLIQVRDLLNGQSWFDVTQYRADAPGGGVPMHWSRIVDVPLALVILLLTPVLGGANAEIAGLVITPLITLGVAMLLAARIAWRLLGDEETNFTALIMAVCVPVLFQLGPMRIDHHGWQLVCALAAMNGLMARSMVAGGRVVGASLATWLTISIEGLPLAAVIFGVLALRWLRDPKEKTLLVSAIQALAVTCAALFALTRGFDDFATYCDAISPIHLAMFGWGAVVLSVLARLEVMPMGARLGGFALAAGGALAMVLVSSPQCATGGGFSELDPLVHDYWYVNVREGMPVWAQTLTVALQYAVTPLIGLYAAINLASRSNAWLGRFWSDYAMILGGSIVIALLVARAGAVACLLAAPPLAWQLNLWLRSIRKMERPLPRVGALLAVACALLPTLPLSMSALVLPARAQIASAATGNLKVSNCRIEANADILNALEPGEVFTPLDIAPTVLLVSHHSVQATGHHRGNEAMREVIDTVLGSSAAARAKLTERGSQYLAVCPDLIEPSNYKESAPDGFMADLLDGREPDWLEPIATAEGTSFKLWRIKPE